MSGFIAKCIGVSLLILAISIAFYLLIYYPQRSQTFSQQQSRIQSESDFENKRRCTAEGEKLLEEDKKIAFGNLYEPVYYYNKKLNTCLYSVNKSFPWTEEDTKQFPDGCFPYEIKVMDSFTRETVLFIGRNGPRCEYYPITREEFDKKYQELFSQ